MIAADLPGHRVDGGGRGSARFVPVGEGVSFSVVEHVEKRFLGRTTVARFVVEVDREGASGSITIRHKGNTSRVGLTTKTRHGNSEMESIAGLLEADAALERAALPLDFKKFEVVGDGVGVKATIELMGGAVVAVAFPPMRSYVRLYPDQRDALLATLTEVERILSGV